MGEERRYVVRGQSLDGQPLWITACGAFGWTRDRSVAYRFVGIENARRQAKNMGCDGKVYRLVSRAEAVARAHRAGMLRAAEMARLQAGEHDEQADLGSMAGDADEIDAHEAASEALLALADRIEAEAKGGSNGPHV